MLNGDLEMPVTRRMVVVLEGPLAKIDWKVVKRRRKRFGKKEERIVVPPASTWEWSVYVIKQIVDAATRIGLRVDVVTFISEEAATEAMLYFDMYDVRVATVQYMEYETFAASLVWRPDIDRVVDTDPDRLQFYGAKAFETVWGGRIL